LKLYLTRRARDISWKNQTIAHKARIGPKVYEKFVLGGQAVQYLFEECSNIPWDWSKYDAKMRPHLFGFITEAVEDVTITEAQFALLQARMLVAGFYDGDICVGANTGLLRGKPVCYDFDEESVGVL